MDHADRCIVHEIRLYKKIYQIHNLLHELHVIPRCHYYRCYTENRFSVFLRRLSHNGPRKFFLEIMKFLWWIPNEMNPKMVIGYTGFGKGLLQSPFSKQLTLSDRNMIQKLSSVFIQYKANYTKIRNLQLYDIRGTQYTTIHLYRQKRKLKNNSQTLEKLW